MSRSTTRERTPLDRITGLPLGEPRMLATWEQVRAACDAIAERSNRMRTLEFGVDWGGRTLPLYAISTPETMRRLEAYQELQREIVTLRRAERWDEIAGLLPRMKLIVLVTCGIHATEVGATQLSPELLYHLANSRSESIRSILTNAIVLFAPSLNPSGMNLVHDWYARTLGTRYEGTNPPYPDHPVGHDVNRDWTMRTQPETRAFTEHVLNAWRPHVHLDLHQMQPNGPRYVVPPFVDPIDPHVSSSAVAWMDRLGIAMAEALRERKHRGVASGVIFDAYTPGRSYVNYHGGIRMLAEAASAKIATTAHVAKETLPTWRGFDPHVSSPAQPDPWPGGDWSLRDVMRMHEHATMALLGEVVANRDDLLRDLHAPVSVLPGPACYVIPPYHLQRDAGATAALISTMISADVDVERLSNSVSIDGAIIPPGAYLLRSHQPNGSFLRSLFSRSLYPGDALSQPHRPHVPYDVTGHTLPLLMGVDLVELPSTPEAPSVRLSIADQPRGWITGTGRIAFGIAAGPNAVTTVVNSALANGSRVARLLDDDAPSGLPRGSFVVTEVSTDLIESLVDLAGFGVAGLAAVPKRAASLRPVTVGIYRSWRPNVPDAGWLDLVLREHGFAVREVRDAQIRSHALRDLDVIVLPSQTTRELLHGNNGIEYPDEYCGGIGRLGMTALRTFCESGGTVIAIDAACDAALASLPTGTLNVVAGLGPDLFQTPGAIVRLDVDTAHPLGWGMERAVAAVVTNSPVFDFRPGHVANPQTVACYPQDDPLLSGWLIGSQHLAGRAALVDIPFGRGRLVLFGFRPYFRAQTHGTYGFLFNALFRAGMAPAPHDQGER